MPATINRSDAAVNRSISVKVTGSGTSWTGATTFSVSGGIAPSISSLSISGQVATFTLNPGSGADTLTITDSTNGTTVNVTVASTATYSGTGLTSWNTFAQYAFDAGNPFVSSDVGHTIEVSGGTGFTAGRYHISGVTVNANLAAQGQGTQNVAFLTAVGGSTGAGPYSHSGTASGGSWTYTMRAGGSGLAGKNLIPWSADTGRTYYYDPDAPFISAMNGATMTVDAGTGFNAGTYTIINFLSAFATNAGTQNLIQVSASGGLYPAASINPSTTVGWIKAGGETIPTATVNTSYVGAIKVLLIGDSITQAATGLLTPLQAQYPNAASVSVVNRGNSGTTAAEWLIGSGTGNLTGAITAANTQGTKVVSIMLGTNDSKTSGRVSVATHIANIQAIVTSLFSGIPTLRRVVLQESPYIVAGSGGGTWDATSNTRTQEYYAAYSGVTGGTQGTSTTNTNYAFFSRNAQLLGDGVHPTGAGNSEVYYTWLTSMAASIVAADASPSPAVTGAHLTSAFGFGFGF